VPLVSNLLCPRCEAKIDQLLCEIHSLKETKVVLQEGALKYQELRKPTTESVYRCPVCYGQLFSSHSEALQFLSNTSDRTIKAILFINAKIEECRDEISTIKEWAFKVSQEELAKQLLEVEERTLVKIKQILRGEESED